MRPKRRLNYTQVQRSLEHWNRRYWESVPTALKAMWWNDYTTRLVKSGEISVDQYMIWENPYA